MQNLRNYLADLAPRWWLMRSTALRHISPSTGHPRVKRMLPFPLLQDGINRMKGWIEIFNAPMAQARFQTFGVFEYLRSDEVDTRLDANVVAVLAQTQIIEQNDVSARGLSDHWNEFCHYYFLQVLEFARTRAQDQIRYDGAQCEANPSVYDRTSVLKQLKEIEDDNLN
ncbi:hypothetical protein GQX73_g7772 [Xylaria multiplex]|uniref:Uncharacterized protein n=1 Tax=Xylaria multiplex TaxID=323545 RepID=A0A7C8N163_9PEZI|nr:hypothetical protein GQX73_g7772 [Xylaria multiplex]